MMQKKKFLILGVSTLILVLTGNAQAAPNPDLVALSRAKVVEFTGIERISQPFAFDLEVTVPNPALNFSKIVGQPLTLPVAKGRRVAGIVENIEQSSATGRQGQYHVRIVPPLNRLAYRITSRTFAEMNSVQIVNVMIDEAGVPGLETRIGQTPNVREIAVQYQESELTFFSRLLEHEGIHYHFELSGTGVKTVLGDSNNAFPLLAPGKLMFAPQKTPDRKSTRLNSSHTDISRMPSSA